MKIIRSLAIIMASASVLAACCNCNEQSIEGSWKAQTITGVDEVNAAENTPTLNFKNDNTFSGCAGVNLIFGDYKASKGRIEFAENTGMTKMMADSVSMAVEDAFIAAISEVSQYSFAEDGCLILSNVDGSKSVSLVKVEAPSEEE